MVGTGCPVGQPAALAPTDHGLDDVAEKPACRSAISQFAAPLKVLPGDLERILEELGERDGHEQKTNENRSRSLSSPLRRSLSYFDRNRLGPKDDIAEHLGLRRVQASQTAKLVLEMIRAAETGGAWLMLARIGVLKALHRDRERVFDPIAKRRIGASGS